MCKKTVLMFSLFFITFAPKSLSAKPTTFTNWWGTEYVSNEGQALRDYIQNCCCQLMGSMFTRCESNARNALYDRVINDILATTTIREKSFKKQFVDSLVHKWLIDCIGQQTKQIALNNGFSEKEAQQIKLKIQERVIAKVRSSVWYAKDRKYGLPQGFFEPFLGEFNIIRHIGSIKKELDRSRYWKELLGTTWEYLFGYQQEQPLHIPCNESARPAAPTPSAPPFDEVVESAPTYPTKKLYVTDECGASCFTHFKNDNEERLFLPCGHNFCSDCAENWFFIQKKNSCPQCRQELSRSQKNRLRSVIENRCAYCVGCNEIVRGVNTFVCGHRMCQECTNAWHCTTFKDECPRCCCHLRYQ